jgi:hypothetical protein
LNDTDTISVESSQVSADRVKQVEKKPRFFDRFFKSKTPSKESLKDREVNKSPVEEEIEVQEKVKRPASNDSLDLDV